MTPTSRLAALTLTLLILTALSACGDHEEEAHNQEQHTPTGDELSSAPVAPITFEAAYVVNGAGRSISVINLDTDEVARTIALSGVVAPHHIYADPQGTRLLIADPGVDLAAGHSNQGGHGGHGAAAATPEGAVLMLEARTGALQRAVRLSTSNHNAVFAPDGTIWTAVQGSPAQVSILDPATLMPVHTLTVGEGPSEVTFSAQPRRAFIANTAAGTVSVFNPEDHTLVATLQVGANPVGAWPGRDGLLYVDNEADKTISVIDPAQPAVLRTLDLGFTPAMAAIGPDGMLWVTDTDDGRVVRLHPETGALQNAISTAPGAHALAFTPDDRRLLVTNQNDSSVTLIDVATATVLRKITVGEGPNGLLILPAP